MSIIDTSLLRSTRQKRVAPNSSASSHNDNPDHIDHDGARPLPRQFPSITAIGGRSVVALGRSETSLSDDMPLLQELADAFSAAVAILESGGRVVVVNRQWREMSDALARPDVGDDCDDIATFIGDGEFVRSSAKQLRNVLSGERPEASCRFELPIGGIVRQFEMRARPLRLPKSGYVIVINDDVSLLHALRRDKRILSDQLVNSEERERQRIARELHDSTVQDLVAIGLNLRRLSNLGGDAETAEIFSDIREILKRAQQDVRTMSYLLHPPMLDKSGLRVALDALVRGLAQRMDIRIHFEAGVDNARFPIDAELALYRVVQEALINVHCHAHATRAVVRYRWENLRLVVEVDDDGIGFDVADEQTISIGVGINGMRARLRPLGGSLTISRLSPGTRLQATVPIEAASGAFN
jgi:two-component system, NarL family, sensor kinase